MLQTGCPPLDQQQNQYCEHASQSFHIINQSTDRKLIGNYVDAEESPSPSFLISWYKTEVSFRLVLTNLTIRAAERLSICQLFAAFLCFMWKINWMYLSTRSRSSLWNIFWHFIDQIRNGLISRIMKTRLQLSMWWLLSLMIIITYYNIYKTLSF